MTSDLGSFPRQHAGAQLFAVIAGSYGEETLRVMREALQSGDPNQVSAVGSLLRRTPRTFVWDQLEFVCEALRTADRHGEEVVQQIAGGLHAGAIGGIRSGSPQQPFAEDIQLRDTSAEILSGLTLGSVEEKFYRALAESAQRSIQWKSQIDDQLTNRRDW